MSNAPGSTHKYFDTVQVGFQLMSKTGNFIVLLNLLVKMLQFEKTRFLYRFLKNSKLIIIKKKKIC